ncbi:MAG: SAM-dependent chlorinase/fluorinase [Acidobacteria bacterium]|nr:SAM-dependent chlorinase/fluorinase [Acidobacteriota bacterium]
MPRPLMTLLTDFGHTDHFVAVMKGVILSIQPNAELIDITHDVPPFSVPEGAYLIAEAYRWFPKKTIHIVVVDPGVGSARRPLLMEAAGQLFLAPDNGVLSMVRAEQPKNKVREILNSKLMLPALSRTFHGRDLFAPVAAHLTKLVKPAQVGPLVKDALQLRLATPEHTNKRAWTGGVIHIDSFGNLVTNFKVTEFERIRTNPFELAIGFEKIHRLALHYAECPFGQPFLIEGSSGYLEVAVNQGHAAKQLGCSVGAPVELTLW